MHPPHIRYYVSDYGYGHASRAIAVIRALKQELDAEVSIRAYTSADFLHRSLPECTLTQKRNDVGVVMHEGTANVDPVETERQLIDWVRSWDAYIAEETTICKKVGIDLILSDISPQVFPISRKLEIPGVGISNFTWELIFRELYGNTSEIQKIHDAYRCADMACVLPLHESMSVFPRSKSVSLISRKLTRSREQMRKIYGLGNEVVVYLGSGQSISAVPDCVDALINRGVTVLLSGNQRTHAHGVITIPESDMETQDHIGMCDLVVTKPGYSTISEAISSRIPLILFPRKGFAEDQYIVDPIVKNSIGCSMSWDEVRAGEWVSDLEYYLSLKARYDSCSDMFMRDGTKDCIELIRSLL